MNRRCLFGDLPFALCNTRSNKNHELPGAGEKLPVRKKVSPEQHSANVAERRYAQLFGMAGKATQRTPRLLGKSKREPVAPLDFDAIRDVGHEFIEGIHRPIALVWHDEPQFEAVRRTGFSRFAFGFHLLSIQGLRQPIVRYSQSSRQ